jgi:uncharacterized protein YkwD
VHHTPCRPPLSTRLTAALRRALRPRGRLGAFAVVCGVAAVLAVVVPMLVPAATAGGDDQVSLDSSATSATGEDGSSVVQLGVDGAGAATGSSTDPSAAGSPAPGSSPAADAPGASAPVAEDPAAASQPAATGAATGHTTTSSSPVLPTSSSPSSSSAPRAAAAPAPAAAPASSAAPRAATPRAAAPVAAAAPADPSAEGQVLTLVNQQRAAAGCGAVVADAGLASLARAHSADMRDRGYFSHDTPEGLSPFDRADKAGIPMYAENIAYGQPDAAAVMDDWMNSPGHRANILDCDLKKLGVGVATGPGGPWWTQDFA